MTDAARYVGAVAGVGLLTAAVSVLLSDPPIATVAMLYLAAVLATAVSVGRGPAIVSALAAFLCFNWFFVEPLHHLTVSDPRDLVVLFVFLLVAGVTGQLGASQRARAEEARSRERETALLYELARILGESSLDQALPLIAARLRAHFEVAAVAIEVQGSAPRSFGAGEGSLVQQLTRNDSSREVLEPGGGQSRWVRIAPPSRPAREAGARRATVPLLIGGRRVGALHIARSESRRLAPREGRLLDAVGTQLASAMDRDTLHRQAIDAEVLRRTDALRAALLDAVSHDLRTPLSSILASASSLRESDIEWTASERDDFLRAIEDEARRLDRLVRNLLDASRIQAGELRPVREWHDAAALVDDVVTRMRPLLREHALASSVQDDLPPVRLDYIAIDQVLTNLIENAAKFAPPGSEIEVVCDRSDDSLRFAVADHGPGIPAASVARAFEPFARGHLIAGSSGVGLGLSIAKRLVEGHAGAIWYEARPGGGSRFVFTLPLRQEAPA